MEICPPNLAIMLSNQILRFVSVLLPPLLKFQKTFLLCPWTTPIWFSLSLAEIPSPEGLSSIHQWILLEKHRAQNHPLGWERITQDIFITFWFIWNERNSFTFEDAVPSAMSVIMKTQSLSHELSKHPLVPPKICGPVLRKPNYCWRPPFEGTLKCNTDASFNPLSGKSSGAFLFRDHRGVLLAGSAFNFCASSCLIAETVVLREAISFAINLGISDAVFETDSLELAHACRSMSPRGEISHLVNDISPACFTLPEVWFPVDCSGRKLGGPSSCKVAILRLPPS